MPDQLKVILLKRGTTSKAAVYTGQSGEVVIDTDLTTLRVMNGSLPGGVLLARGDHVHQISDIPNLSTELAGKAPLASPALSGIPTAPTAVTGNNSNQLATTSFVNSAIGAGNAASATKLATSRSFSVSGDMTSSAVSFDGTGNVSLSASLTNTGVAAGSYTKLTVDAKGRVTAGSNLTAVDVPSLDWSKISTGKPTTLSGYGITDAAPLASPALTGTPTAPTVASSDSSTRIATTAFVKSVISGGSSGQFSSLVVSGSSSFADISVSNGANIAGSAVVLNTSSVTMLDPIVTIGGLNVLNVNDNKDRGVEFRWHNGTASKLGFFGFDVSAGKFTVIPDAINTGEVISGSAGTIVANIEGDVTGNAGTATKLATARTITTSGDAISSAVSFDGSSNISIPLTLANSGVTAGTYPKVTVDAKGRVTAGASLSATDIPSLDWSKIATGKPTTLSGYGITDAAPLASPALTGTPTAPTALAGTNTTQVATTAFVTSAVSSGVVASANKLTVARTIATTGDATSTAVSFDGSANISIPLTLVNSGVTAGTYPKVTVDAKGRVTAGSSLAAADIPSLDWSKLTTGKPTTLTGYGITDAASLASPALTGVPTAPTAAVGTNTTQLATTAFVQSALGSTIPTITTSGDGNIGGNLIVGGNLVVNGSTTTVNSTTMTIDDPIVTLGGDTAPTLDDGKDRGIEFRWHNGVSAKLGFFGFDDSTGKFTFIPDATNTSEVFSGTTGTIVANLEGAVTGNASTATKLATARTITASGDATSSAVSFDGSANISIPLTLANSGVTAGTYPKVTVDSKGRVTAGVGLVATDIPSLDWSKIATGKPTTLSGYGITDAAPLASPALSGTPTAPTAAPGTSTTQVATTAFVAAAVADSVSNGITGSAILSKLASVDGAGSGLDADTIDGIDSALLARVTAGGLLAAGAGIQLVLDCREM